jgi:hypothetical protein
MIRPLALASLSAIALLAACNTPESVEPDRVAEAPASPTVPATPGPPVSAADKLTADGYGPLRIGMTRAEVEAALGPDSDREAAGGPDPESCDMFRPARAPKGLIVMVEDDILTSVWATDADIETDRGLNVGDIAAEVRRVYGAAVQSSPHEYQDAPAEYLIVGAGGPSMNGVKYEVASDGRVASIAGGGPSIRYVEGCA